LAYDRFNARGKDDAENNLDVLGADIELVSFAKNAQNLYKSGGVDPITGETATFDLYVTGQTVDLYFSPIVKGKQSAFDYIKQQVGCTDLCVQDILNNYNTENETNYTTTNKRDDF
jgi:hypothetical protein